MLRPQHLRLRHLHLPSLQPHYVPYSLASRVQEHLRREHLAFKDANHSGNKPLPQPPPPALISFTPAPVFTLGRRQTAPLTREELAKLTAPLKITSPPPFSGFRGAQAQARQGEHRGEPEPCSYRPHPRVTPSPRGGLTTYHGPGQVVLWPVIDLRSVGAEAAAAAAARLSCCKSGLRGGGGLTVRTYARLLETTTMAVLGQVFGLEAVTTEDPGVWVVRRALLEGGEHGMGEGEMAKIAALGVHLRRHITALGTALNVALPGTDGDGDERTNPWSRFIACGLPGKHVTSVAGELARRRSGGFRAGVELLDEMLLLLQKSTNAARTREQAVAEAWAEEFAQGIGLGHEEGNSGVELVDTEEVLGLMEGLVRSAEDEGGDADQHLGEEFEYLESIRRLLGGGA
ncbi:hypothetical protein VTJ49DRAFT_4238 [Mycothermus thermophilus]|uniref:BPL/LPL catalytic domain-containing protein n=1 Tax=Humicola insolens TaxID=85995 RepID=A0ABR3VLJ0_HUMIN